MKSSQWGLMLLGLVIGFAASGGVERQTIAQAPGGTVSPPTQVGRFQISAWGIGSSSANAVGQRGCYIVDTVTGEMWHVAQDGSGGIPKKIGQKLQ